MTAPRRAGLLRRWLGMLALVGGTMASELASPWACRLIAPAQAKVQPQRKRENQ